MAEVREYGGITRTALDCLMGKMKSVGMTVPAGDNGTIEIKGVKFSVSYLETDQKLTFEITYRPVFMPEALVWSMLDTTVRRCTEA